ncbi:MAG: RNA-protein complex protein Nop10 [Thermoplasmata archaeon]|nr:RNA-protein complex protein Nop10 [Thermoplasmata archaeon]
MKSNILVCPECKKYTMASKCPKCDTDSTTPHPPRFSPEDRYGKYRRQLKAMVDDE